MVPPPLSWPCALRPLKGGSAAATEGEGSAFEPLPHTKFLERAAGVHPAETGPRPLHT